MKYGVHIHHNLKAATLISRLNKVAGYEKYRLSDFDVFKYKGSENSPALYISCGTLKNVKCYINFLESEVSEDYKMFFNNFGYYFIMIEKNTAKSIT